MPLVALYFGAGRDFRVSLSNLAHSVCAAPVAVAVTFAVAAFVVVVNVSVHVYAGVCVCASVCVVVGTRSACETCVCQKKES